MVRCEQRRQPAEPIARTVEAVSLDDHINNEIRSEYDDAEAAGTKQPNIRELGAPVQLRLDRKGFHASKRRIQILGEADEFKIRRRPPGKTLKSERPK